ALPAFFAGALNGFFAAFACVLALALRLGASVSGCSASSAAAGAAATGFGSGLGLAVLVGFAPSVRISVTRMSVNSCRWPRFLRAFFRRRFLKAMIFGPRPCSRTSAATEAPATVGWPKLTLSPPTTKTSPNCTISPGEPLTLSTLITSSAATRYCLPPVLMTANIVLVLVFDAGARISPDRLLQSVVGFAGANRPNLGAERQGSPHPIAPKPSGPLKTHVDPGRRAGHAYGGRGRNCQGNGPFGVHDRLMRGDRRRTFQFAPPGQFAHIKCRQRASHERARQPCLRQDERPRQ